MTVTLDNSPATCWFADGTIELWEKWSPRDGECRFTVFAYADLDFDSVYEVARFDSFVTALRISGRYAH